MRFKNWLEELEGMQSTPNGQPSVNPNAGTRQQLTVKGALTNILSSLQLHFNKFLRTKKFEPSTTLNFRGLVSVLDQAMLLPEAKPYIQFLNALRASTFALLKEMQKVSDPTVQSDPKAFQAIYIAIHRLFNDQIRKPVESMLPKLA